MIYLLEDDENIREFVLYALSGQNYQVQGFERPSQLYRALEEEIPELLLLDVMLPEEDGLSVLRRLRSATATKRLPVIILSAKDTEYDKIQGLDGGADDYLPKPFGMLELMSRIRALLRRSREGAPAAQLRDGELIVVPACRQVTVQGQEVALTPKEFEILCVLLEHPGVVVNRTELQNRVWGAEYLGETRTVDVHIRTLRQKLGEYGEAIETARGIGYRWRKRE